MTSSGDTATSASEVLVTPTTLGALSNASTTNPADPSGANISTRTYIYFLPYPLPAGTPVPYTLGLPDVNPLHYPPNVFEPTQTLVLTSPAKTFVDLRIFKPMKVSDPPLPNDGGGRERLEWGFAGTASSAEIADPFTAKTGGSFGEIEGQRTWAGPVTHASWTHWLDTRHPIGTALSAIPVDEGVMFPLSATETLEHGSAINFCTGHMHSYEEFWTDEPMKPTHPSTKKQCIVLRVDIPEHRVRGVVIRLGQFCQGIVMKDAYATIERWVFEEKKGKKGKVVGGDWTRVARIGDQFLPCAPAMKPEVLMLDGMVKYADYEWTVEEMVEWD